MNDGRAVITKAGFVTFPNQVVAEDSSAPTGSVFYDRAFSKWLPVSRNNVSPDGKRYAYGEGKPYLGTPGSLHVVDVATGVDRIIYSGGLYFVVDFAAEGIYVTVAVPEGSSRGLWLQDPAGGPPRQISSTIVAPAMGGGAAWGQDFNAADPNPGPGGLEGPKNQILRYDLRTGASTPWFYRPGANGVYVVGFDAAGDAFVRAEIDTNGTDTFELWLVASSSQATKLVAGDGQATPYTLGAVDSHGAWFNGSGGARSAVWLYAGGSIQSVGALDLPQLSIAGGCIP